MFQRQQKGIKDRALLLIGFGAALRRSEIVALNVEDVDIIKVGLNITVKKSKTDQEGIGQVVSIPREVTREDVCPVVALKKMVRSIKNHRRTNFYRYRSLGEYSRQGHNRPVCQIYR